MANRRCLHALTRHSSALLSRAPASLTTPPIAASSLASKSLPAVRHLFAPISPALWPHPLHFSSDTRDSDGDEDDEETDEEYEDGEETEGDYEEEEEDSDFIGVSRLKSGRRYTPEEKEAETAAIGYKVIGPLEDEDRVFKPYKPVFAVVQIGSHQFKVSNTDCIFVERLKFCEVNDKLILNKVLLLGSSAQTIIGRPFLPEAAVHAVVEEHALDAKVIIFKKKRRKNYRRTNGHRQELTKLRITDIEGIEVPETEVAIKPPKAIVTGKKPEKVPIAS